MYLEKLEAAKESVKLKAKSEKEMKVKTTARDADLCLKDLTDFKYENMSKNSPFLRG